MSVAVRYATIEDLEPLATLFDAYRQFYGQASDLPLAREFLAERFKYQQALVLVAAAPSGALVGFTQLFPSFSSVRACRMFVLNDLFVAPAVRRQGVARELLVRAAEAARSLGAESLSLATARSNHGAQKLYESLGWRRDEQFLHYDLALSGRPD
jgi:ribosomal protein S18 acetylase RimI-like enzyme